MWMGMIGFNVLCLAAAAFALRRLLRPAPVEDAGGSFAQVLAAAAPLARRLMNRGNLSALEEPRATAAAFVEYVLSPAGASVLTAAGFQQP